MLWIIPKTFSVGLFMAEVIFYLIREYQKVLPIYVGKIKFQGTLFMKWQFLIQVTGRKRKKILNISGFLESYDDII